MSMEYNYLFVFDAFDNCGILDKIILMSIEVI